MKIRQIWKIIPVVILLTFYFGGTKALAITIDGLPSDWGTILPLGSDPNEPLIPDNYDISAFYVTNDNSNLYFRMDVFGTPTLTGVFPSNSAFYQIYLDTDQQAGTGLSIYGIGADRIIDYRSSGVTVYDAAGNNLGGGNGGQNTITELGVSAATLGLSNGTNIDMVAYLDNGGPPADDYISNTGSFTYTYPIPEPATLLLLGGGLLSLTAMVRKRLS